MLPAAIWWALFMLRHSLAINCVHQVALCINNVVVSLTRPMLHRSGSGNSVPNSEGQHTAHKGVAPLLPTIKIPA